MVFVLNFKKLQLRKKDDHTMTQKGVEIVIINLT